jgi:hypothetical protein
MFFCYNWFVVIDFAVFGTGFPLGSTDVFFCATRPRTEFASQASCEIPNTRRHSFSPEYGKWYGADYGLDS